MSVSTPLEVGIETPRSTRGRIAIRWNHPVTSQLKKGNEAKLNFEMKPKVEGLIWSGVRSASFKPEDSCLDQPLLESLFEAEMCGEWSQARFIFYICKAL